MTALVTGGAGFIGRHLTRRLLADGHRVTVLDDFSTGSRSGGDELRARGAEVVDGSVLDAALVDRLVAAADTVFHLAAVVGVRLVVRSPLACLRTNIHGTEQVLAAALAHGARVLLASTSEVYGRNDRVPLAEDADRVLGPPQTGRWSYAEAKAVDEALAAAYHRECRLWTVACRLFNVIGPGQTGRYGMVLPRFVDQALRGEPLTVYGDGGQTRSFCYVGDAVTGLIALAECTAAQGKAVNIGRPQEVSIVDLARRVLAATGSPSVLRFVPYHEVYGPDFEDPPRRQPDISLARRLIGFDPRTDLDEVIRLVIDERQAAATATGRPDAG
jgi:UDP-glucose 4-epimerase